MRSSVFDFKAINRKLNRQEQKAEFEAKSPKPEPSSMYASGTVVWTPEHGYALPCVGSCDSIVLTTADLPVWPNFKI